MQLSNRAAEVKYRFSRQLQTIRLFRTAADGGKNEAAFDHHTGSFDPKLERAWNKAHPEKMSTLGFFQLETFYEDVGGMFVNMLGEEEQRMLMLGDFNVDNALYLGPADVSLENVIEMEYPIGSGTRYRLFSPDFVYYADDPIYTYCKLERAERPPDPARNYL